MRSARELLRPATLPAWQQDGLIALLLLAVGLPVYLGRIYLLVPGTDSVPLWVRLLELLVVSGLVPLRRRVPAGLLLATVVLVADIVFGPSLPVVIAYTDFLYAATFHGSHRMTRIMVGIAVVSSPTLLAVLLAVLHDWRTALFVALGVLPLLVVPVWWAANVRQHRDIADAERANAAQVARIAELDRKAAVRAERARMARDLHDIIAGHLSAIAIQSEAALSMTDDPRTAHTVLESARSNSISALDEMRTMIGLLRDDADESETTAPGRLAELSRLVESARAGGMSVTVRSTVDGTALPAAVDLTAYRIAQEALTNTMKHAPGAEVVVDIRRHDGILTVEVGNALPPGTASGDPGHGLLNMRERARTVGGTVTAGPSGSAWVVRAELPVAKGPA